MAYKGNGDATAENVYKCLYTKLPLNRAVPAGQFTSTGEWDVNHPTLGHNTDFQTSVGGGIRSSRDQDMSPLPPHTNTTLIIHKH